MRGFTLIEMLVALSILGIMVAIAVPNMNPMIDLEQLRSGTNQVAAFTARARTRAIADRRCVRVVVFGQNTLRAQVLNTFDCEDPAGAIAATGLGIDGTAAVWRTAEEKKLELRDVTVSVVDAGEASAGEVRFRPNGRLFSDDANLADDRSRLRVTHVALPAGGNFREIGVFSQGTLQVTGVGVAATAVGQNQ